MGEHNDGPVRKRRRVAAEHRKRATTACAACRRLKEKCDDGHWPCERCLKHGRTCEKEQPASIPSHEEHDERRRISLLETLVRHLFPGINLNTTSLQELALTLDSEDALTTSYPSNSSHSDDTAGDGPDGSESVMRSAFDDISCAGFALQLQRHVFSGRAEHDLLQPKAGNHILRPNYRFDREDLPPREVADFLTDIYFEYAQTVTPFVEKEWIRSRLEHLYTLDPILEVSDTPWMCCVFAVFAIGAQFSHFGAIDDHGIRETLLDWHHDDGAGVIMYQKALELLPDIVHFGSLDSAQALLLLAHFALAHDNDLAIRYLEMSTCISRSHSGKEYSSISNGELKAHRIVDVADTWKRHLYILRGEASIPSSTCIATIRSSPERISTSWDTMHGLVDWSEEINRSLDCLTKEVVPENTTQMQPLIGRRNTYKKWWASTPCSTTPFVQLDRTQAHLHLHHCLNKLALGRPFIFASMRDVNDIGYVANPRLISFPLVEDAEFAAYDIIDICSTLGESSVLSKASHIESTACHAAVIVMLAQGFGYRCTVFHNKLALGMKMLQDLVPADELSRLQALHRRIVEITAVLPKDGIRYTDDSQKAKYIKFRCWTAASKINSSAQSHTLRPSDFSLSPFYAFDWSEYEAIDFGSGAELAMSSLSTNEENLEVSI